MAGEERVGVVLLQMGGPGSPEELGPFLRNLFSDPDMIRLPWWLRPVQGILGRAYGTYRIGEVRDEYEAIGYSDIVPNTRSLAQRLDRRLDGAVAGVATAMRYTQPRARDAVQALVAAGADRLLAVTLYPFYSAATTGSSLNDLERARDAVAPSTPIGSIDRWGGQPSFLDLQAAWIRRTLESAELGPSRAILLTAHGLPRAYIEDGDPYRREVEQAAAALTKRFPDERVVLAFQSDVGPVEWLRPYTQDAIEALADDGVDELVVVPLGFVSEHIETLYEIDEEYRHAALDAGIEAYHRVPAFDDDPAFVEMLGKLVQERLEGAA